jgi:branched-subunit amino acid transport protein
VSPAAVWGVVAACGLATMALKATGPVLLGGRQLPAPLVRVVGLLGPALLAALVATSVFGGPRRLIVDARALGVAAAAFGVWRRWPPLLVVVVSAAVAAAARAV